MKTRITKKPVVTIQAIQEKKPDRLFYIRDKIQRVNHFFSHSLSEIYHSLWTTWSLDQISFADFRKILDPIILSAFNFYVGNMAAEKLSESHYKHQENAFVFKFLFGAAIMGLSVLNRYNERRPASRHETTIAAANEMVAITYLYHSTFFASQKIFENMLSENGSLVASLGVSGLIIPGMLSYTAKKIQDKLIKKAYKKGAQRSDTAFISSGLTPVALTYFLANHYLFNELMTFSRTFQLGLISDNVLHAKRALQQFRNFPALLVDIGPETIKKILQQYAKVQKDFQYNSHEENVLKFKRGEPRFFKVKRHQLRKDDLVLCDDKFATDAAPISGEVIALHKESSGKFTERLEMKKIGINLKTHNGEDNTLWFQTSRREPVDFKVGLHEIHDGKQIAVLRGAKLELNGADNIFVKIKEEKERAFSSHEEKKSVINEIISQHKARAVKSSFLFAAGASAIETGYFQDLNLVPGSFFKYLFNLSQMMIPFSETFLREMINSRLMKNLNKELKDSPLELIDALRIVDLCHARSGYYHNEFKRGITIISDKTGTLTTSKMNVRGMWTSGMPTDVDFLLNEEKKADSTHEIAANSFGTFAAAFTNNREELEPEEHAILNFYRKQLKAEDCLTVETLKNNCFRKKIKMKHGEATIETIHLGLYRKWGGRFTLTFDGEKKYLIFCGIPRADKFHDTDLLNSYFRMKSRTGVLTRDWCIARAHIPDNIYSQLEKSFNEDNRDRIENILSRTDLLDLFNHVTTFLIDNPLKPGTKNFVTRCMDNDIPLFVATGDTAKASCNIAGVLYPTYAGKINIIREPADLLNPSLIPFKNSTIIFSQCNAPMLDFFDRLLTLPEDERPAIIFSEMSTIGKGALAQLLKNKGYFVVANGDGSNDLAMMKEAHMVVGHVTEGGTLAPGVEQFANLTDKQLTKLFRGGDFYDLFDIHRSDSAFVKLFAQLANSQEKPSVALMLKSSKMGFELGQSIGMPVKEMPHQHWFSVGFDLAWLWMSFNEINDHSDLPMENKHLVESNFSNRAMAGCLIFAALDAFLCYMTTGESTNLTNMLIMLSFLPIVLRSIFSGYREVQRTMPMVEVLEEKPEVDLKPSAKFSFFGKCFKNKKAESVTEHKTLKRD